MSTAIRLEDLGKLYRLGEIGSGTVAQDFQRAWAKFRGKPDPLARVGDTDAFGGNDCVWALKDLSLTVPRGAILGIVGHNGAGKSTLLKLLSRITAPTTGTIAMKGRIASLLEVGTGFHPELTGKENIYLNGAILGMTRQEISAKLDEIVDFSGCARFLDTPVKRYSSGMMVRLGFAVAAHLECEILVVDEVLAVGDMEFQRKCIGRMQEVASSGRTVLFVSHNMGSVESLCTSAILVSNGVLADQGSPSEVVDRYLSLSAKESRMKLASGETSYIKSVRLLDENKSSKDQFRIGDTIIFEADLFPEVSINEPRFSFSISKSGVGQIATLHTDVQHSPQWALDHPTRVHAIWKNVSLNVGQYSVDVCLWGHSSEKETLLGCCHFHIEMRDVYGTGSLPDPSYQGHLVPEATWEIESQGES